MKQLSNYIFEKLKISASENNWVFDFEELCEINSERYKDFEKFGDILFNNKQFGMYNQVFWHVSSGRRQKLMVYVPDSLYEEVRDKNPNSTPNSTMINEKIGKKLSKLFGTPAEQIYVFPYKSYIDELNESDSIYDIYDENPDFIKWLHHYADVSGLEFKSYDIQYYFH